MEFRSLTMFISESFIDAFNLSRFEMRPRNATFLPSLRLDFAVLTTAASCKHAVQQRVQVTSVFGRTAAFQRLVPQVHRQKQFCVPVRGGVELRG